MALQRAWMRTTSTPAGAQSLTESAAVSASPKSTRSSASPVSTRVDALAAEGAASAHSNKEKTRSRRMAPAQRGARAKVASADANGPAHHVARGVAAAPVRAIEAGPGARQE